MAKPYQNVGPRSRATPQSQPIPGRQQVQNSAGGFVFALDDWGRLERFLILGSEGGTYYVREQQLTRDNAGCVERCLQADGLRTVQTIQAISEAGRAPKNEPALLALAMAASLGDEAVRKAALTALPRVARIGTHLFHFVGYVEQFRGWGRALKQGVSRWYLERQPADLALQLAKYQQRDGWSHRDLLRLAKPRKVTGETAALLRWAVGKEAELPSEGAGTGFLAALQRAQAATQVQEVVAEIREHRLPRECIPTQWLNAVPVWEALLERMPLQALIRNLAKLSAIGLLKPLSEAEARVCELLGNAEALHRARLHPLAVLIALRQYQAGHGEKGHLTWQPCPRVMDALDAAFGLAFAQLEPTDQRFYLGVDVSGSMDCGAIAGTTLTPREGAAALAMQIARTEARYVMRGFAATHVGSRTTMTDLGVTARDTLAQVCAKARALPMGGTDCALPMLDALQSSLEVDCFVVLTDNETWAGQIHPFQALRQYRERTGIPARLVVVGMTATGFTIADPDDARMLDVVGFDAAAPAVIADFVRG